ncbi:MAG: diguanylate cyclase [Cloacibacillus sp.]
MIKKFFSINLIISVIIISGFLLSGLSSFFSFQELFKKDIEAVSELTSENIFVNINNLMDRPINVSTAMAHDTFLRDFVKKEQPGGLSREHLLEMKDYLASYQKKYNFDSVFFISTKTHAYYHYKNGLDRLMGKGNPENIWYYAFLNDPAEVSLNVDNDESKNDVITIFVNYKLYDEEKNLLGVVGVGMETPYIQKFLMENENKFGVHAYLIDAAGNVQLSSTITEFEGVNLFKDKVYAPMAAAINTLGAGSDHRWYHTKQSDGYIITRYVPNLNWYLVVEKSTMEFQRKMLTQFAVSLAFMLFVILVVIGITTGLIKKYSLKLSHLAEMDQLTGIKNRRSYESETAAFAAHLDKFKSFGIGVLDLNNLKATNDLYGHQAGDEYLKIFAELLCETFRGCPVYRIGGDEFAVVFRDVPEETVRSDWDALRRRIEVIKSEQGHSISAAFGYAFWDASGLDTIEKVFKEADDRMYLHKKQIRGEAK